MEATESKPVKTGGGGRKRQTAATTIIDSPPENLLQLAAKMDRECLEAVQMLCPSYVEGYKMKDGKTRFFDPLMLAAFQNPEEGKKHFQHIGHIFRRGMQSLIMWTQAADHVPSVRDDAQRLLADLVRMLVESDFVKLTRRVGDENDAFASRWQETRRLGRGRTDFAAVRFFGGVLMRDFERLVEDLALMYPEVPENAPAHVASLANLIQIMAKNDEETSPPELPRFYVDSVKSLVCRPELYEQAWQKFFWPLAKETWPAFAREHEHFRGWGKNKNGRMLSERKRSVDQKTEFSAASWESEIKSAFEDSVHFYRCYVGV
ncbi:hypothetical protein [Roseimicrobium sp. ORNL1]|uniref:hypothetical protein n=1 Tax=Roseimicrobium sp. ORNL1 TaxID=2711231 RepID=UPI0013E17AEB|nr:hypothetical protein [Roseimicrobium sp. ORNL1]QIF05189.1 hypothetical protein G5S37_27975 [Roseimicrobium sp. ORNL1]